MRCETCGNEYRRSISVRQDGVEHAFDCFECAIQGLAPRCGHCNCAVIGHGVEHENGQIFCCEHCGRVAQGSAVTAGR